MSPEDHQILKAAEYGRRGRARVAYELGMSPTRLHQRLLGLVQTREAAEAYPVLVARQRRLDQLRREARTLR